MDIEKIYAEFMDSADAAKNELQEVLLLIQHGIAPSDVICSNVETSLANLREKYISIRNAAKDEAGKDVDDNKPVSEYYQIVKASSKSKFESIMRQFLRIKSLEEQYQLALVPYQQEAEALLAKLETVASEDINRRYSSACSNEALLIQALGIDDIDDGSHDEFLDKLEAVYHKTVVRGTRRGKYYIAEADASCLTEPIIDDMISEPVPSAIEEEETVPSIPGESEVRDTKEDEQIDDREQRLDGPADDSNETSKAAKSVDIPTYEDSDEFGTLVIEDHSDKLKSFSKFTSMFFGKNSPLGYLRDTVRNLYMYSPVSASLIARRENIDLQKMTSNLDKLCEKGIAAKIHTTACEEHVLYWLTRNVHKWMDASLSKFNIKKRTIYCDITAASQVFDIYHNAEFFQMLFQYANSFQSHLCRNQIHSISCISNDTRHCTAAFFNPIVHTVEQEFDVKQDLLKCKEKAEWTIDSRTVFFVSSMSIELAKKWQAFLTEISVIPADAQVYCGVFGNKEFTSDTEMVNLHEWLEKLVNKSNEPEPVQKSAADEIHEPVSQDTPIIDSNENLTESDSLPADDSSSPEQVRLNAPAEQDITEELLEADDAYTDVESHIPDNTSLPDDMMVEFSDNDSVREYTIKDVIPLAYHPSDADFLRWIDQIIQERQDGNDELHDAVRATLLAYAASIESKDSDVDALTRKLLMATHLPYGDYHYNTETVSEILGDCPEECIAIAIYLQALITPEGAYNSALFRMSENTLKNYDSAFPALKPFKALFNKAVSIHDICPEGFSRRVIALLSDSRERKEILKKIQSDANKLLQVPAAGGDLGSLFKVGLGADSDIGRCLRAVASSQLNKLDTVLALLNQYCDETDGIYSINENKLKEKLVKLWNDVKYNMAASLDDNSQKKEYNKAKSQFSSRLDILIKWVEQANDRYNGNIDITRLTELRRELVSLTIEAKKDIDSIHAPYRCILRYAADYIEKYLSKADTVKTLRDEFLYSGVFTSDEVGAPVLQICGETIPYYEPWRNMLRHITSDIVTSDAARECIIERYDSPLFDNLNQLKKLNQQESDEPSVITDQQIGEAKKAAEDKTKKFKEDLELAYTYDRISEADKESLSAIMEQHKPLFYKSLDFGCWGQFLEALRASVNDTAKEKKAQLRHALDLRVAKLTDGERSELLQEAEELLEKQDNFAVTEEYISRFDKGERKFSDDLYAVLHEDDSFSRFISPSSFKKLYDICQNNTGKAVKAFAWNYLEKNLPGNWTSRQKEDSKKLVESWPSRKGITSDATINSLFSHLGFDVARVSKDLKKTEDVFEVTVSATARSMADYRHPIAIFGTLVHNPINVIVLYGNFAAKQLVDTITAMDFGGMSIVLLDRYLDLTVRRQIGEIFRTQTSGQNPFLVIDQVLLLYLAMHQETERLPVLLKCTLPYTNYQPFVRDGGSTPDEMFCGRVKELSTIMDPNGACVVYGGRQLGKTALLQRAESRVANEKSHDYAVYVNIIDCTSEEALAKKLQSDINKKTKLQIPSVKSLSQFCTQIDKLFRDSRVHRMLLLLDEADKFLDAISSQKYAPLQPLINLRRETTNQFKFVLAGLHNVCRAKNATAENGVFGQLGSALCIKPLSPTDALQLLSRPLKYLGFSIDRYPHLETILTKTNYYPGILQFFGYNLVEALNTQYSRYYSAQGGNPPFTLQDEQLGAVMNDADLSNSIKEKFRWSLELDPRYFMLARCITMLYITSEDGNWQGFTSGKIKEMAEEFEIQCLSSASASEYILLLDEMAEMGILSKSANNLYRLRRNSFVDIIGSDFDTLSGEIMDNNVEVPTNG